MANGTFCNNSFITGVRKSDLNIFCAPVTILLMDSVIQQICWRIGESPHVTKIVTNVWWFCQQNRLWPIKSADQNITLQHFATCIFFLSETSPKNYRFNGKANTSSKSSLLIYVMLNELHNIVSIIRTDGYILAVWMGSLEKLHFAQIYSNWSTLCGFSDHIRQVILCHSGCM